MPSEEVCNTSLGDTYVRRGKGTQDTWRSQSQRGSRTQSRDSTT
jgi:hypothetical protein